jgi:glycosyltransferase involved in cell wall biosynthesis
VEGFSPSSVRNRWIATERELTDPSRDSELKVRSRAMTGRCPRVFYFIDSLSSGGSESQMVQVACRLKSAQYEITVGCLHARGPLLEPLHQAGVPVREFAPNRSLISSSGAHQLLRLVRFLRRERFDVFHSHDLWSNLLGVPAAWLARTPLIISSQRDLGHLWWYTPLRRKVLGWVHRLASVTVANSMAVRQFLVAELGIDPTRIRVIRNGVDCGRFSGLPRAREVLSPLLTTEHKLIAVVANMHRGKGHDLIVQAGRVICQQCPQARFILIGDGEQRPQLEEQVKQMGLVENFLFLGHRKDVPALLAGCDMSLMASEAEGLPNVILESMAAGLPVVAGGVGGILEVLEDGTTGLVVPPENASAIAEAVLRVLEDPSLARRLARAAQQQAYKSFSFDRVLSELQTLYGGAFAPSPQRKV